jgi:hypothetical protein
MRRLALTVIIRAVIAACLALAPAVTPPAAAEEAVIGYVKTLRGSAAVTSGGTTRPLAVAMPVRETDRLETAGDGELGVTFRDDTRVTLGPNSRLDLARFVFKPAEKEYGFVLRLAYGTLQYISGLTAKLAPAAMAIETPSSTIAVRGTRLLVRAER